MAASRTAHFDHIAHRYAGASGGLDAVYAAARPELAGRCAGKDVLDVGGGGVLAPGLETAASVTALDLSCAMLERLPPAVRRVRGDARDLSVLGGARFDVVLFNLSLHHVEGAEGALAQAWGALRPGGELLVHEPLLPPALAALARPAGALLSSLGGGHVRLRTRRDVAASLSAASGRPASEVAALRFAARGWSDPLGGSFPGLLKLPLALHPTRFELLSLRKPHG